MSTTNHNVFTKSPYVSEGDITPKESNDNHIFGSSGKKLKKNETSLMKISENPWNELKNSILAFNSNSDKKIGYLEMIKKIVPGFLISDQKSRISTLGNSFNNNLNNYFLSSQNEGMNMIIKNQKKKIYNSLQKDQKARPAIMNNKREFIPRRMGDIS